MYLNMLYGAILSQQQVDGSKKWYIPLVWYKKSKINYSVTDKELFDAVKSMEHLRLYSPENKFTLRNGHKVAGWSTGDAVVSP